MGTSAVAMGVASQLHNIPIVLGGVFLFSEKVHPFAILGFACCISGALLYTSERRKTSGQKLSQKEDCEMNDFVSNRSCSKERPPAIAEFEIGEVNGAFGVFGDDDVEGGMRSVAATSDSHGCMHEPKPVTIGVGTSSTSAFE